MSENQNVENAWKRTDWQSRYESYRDIRAVNSSSLSAIDPLEGGSPLKFRQYLDGELEEKKGKAVELGTELHRFLFEEEDFVEESVVAPAGMMAAMADEMVRIALEWPYEATQEFCQALDYIGGLESADLIKSGVADFASEYNYVWDPAKQVAGYSKSPNSYFTPAVAKYVSFRILNNEKVVLPIAQLEKYKAVKQSLEIEGYAEIFSKASRKQEHVLFSENEVDVLWNQEEHLTETVSCKARLDHLSFRHDQYEGESRTTMSIIDGKSIHNALYAATDFVDRKQYRQMAMYVLAGLYVAKREGIKVDAIEVDILTMETSEPYRCVMNRVPTRWLQIGMAELLIFLDAIVIQEKMGEWSSFFDNEFMALTNLWCERLEKGYVNSLEMKALRRMEERHLFFGLELSMNDYWAKAKEVLRGLDY